MTEQKPIRCDGCNEILSQIELDKDSPHKSLHWGQKQDYWSVKLHPWAVKHNDYPESKNYTLCNKCKEAMCTFITRKN